MNKISLVFVSCAILASCGRAQMPQEAQVNDVYSNVAEEIFSSLLPASLDGIQTDPSKMVQKKTEKCSLKLTRSEKKRLQFEFTYINPRKGTSETTVIAGEKMSGTLGGTLLTNGLLPPSFQVVVNKDKTAPTQYFVSWLFSEIECNLNSNESKSAIK